MNKVDEEKNLGDAVVDRETEAAAPWLATCDWGDCDDATVGFRFDDNADDLSKTTGYGWLPACQKHYDEEADENRRMKVQ